MPNLRRLTYSICTRRPVGCRAGKGGHARFRFASGGEGNRQRLWIGVGNGPANPYQFRAGNGWERGGTGCEPATSDVLKLLQKNPQSQTRRIRRVNRRPRERLIKVVCRPIRPFEAARCFEPLP